MEEETSALKQSLQGMLNAVKTDTDALGDFREVRLDMRYVDVPVEVVLCIDEAMKPNLLMPSHSIILHLAMGTHQSAFTGLILLQL